MSIDINDISESLLIKRKKVFNGANSRLLAIPSIREKMFGDMNNVVVLVGKYLVVIPDEKEKLKLNKDDYSKIMDTIEAVVKKG